MTRKSLLPGGLIRINRRTRWALLAWLARESPDIVCLQELKAPDERFPSLALRAAGYGAIWHGQLSWNGVAILARGADPQERRRGLPGDPDDTHSRYIEGTVGEVTIGCLYLPNGNPQPGPKFDYKLAWFERLIAHAQELFGSPRTQRSTLAAARRPVAAAFRSR